jgi:CDP-diacylglycerol--inositol 3-phosphatidyltransferase
MSKVSVFLFAPNLIGYARIALAAYAFAFLTHHPILFTLLYITSALLDAVDGHVARYLNQSSTFGAVLDMVTDRASTACLLCLLASVKKELTLIMQAAGAIDLASHYAQMYASVAVGSHSHKAGKALQKAPYLLQIYYGNKFVLFALCAGEQLFLLSLLFLFTTQGYIVMEYDVAELIAKASIPLFMLKQLMNFLQLLNASRILSTLDTTTTRKSKTK